MVQSSRTPVVDMTALDTDTDTDLDTNNSAPADSPPPRVCRGAWVRHRFSDEFQWIHGSRNGEVEVVVEEEVPIDDFRLSAAFHHAFASLDEVNLEKEFCHRATVSLARTSQQ